MPRGRSTRKHAMYQVRLHDRGKHLHIKEFNTEDEAVQFADRAVTDDGEIEVDIYLVEYEMVYSTKRPSPIVFKKRKKDELVL